MNPLQNSKTSVFDVVAGISAPSFLTQNVRVPLPSSVLFLRQQWLSFLEITVIKKMFIPFSEKAKGSAPEKLYGNHMKKMIFTYLQVI